MPFFDEPSIPLSDKDAASGVAELDNMSRLDPYEMPGVVSPLSFRDEWRHWRKACANIASQSVKINVVTDSTHSWTATNYQGSWVWQMFSDLCKVNGQVAEFGFVPLCATTSGAYTGRVWSDLGSATNRSDSGWGYTSSTVPYGTTPSMTSYTSYCDRIHVWYSTYVSLIGAFKVYIDGVEAGSVTQSTGTTLGGRVWDSGALSAASHTVQIVPQNASFPSTIEGASFFAGNHSAGFELIDGGHFGQKSDVFAAASASGQWHMDGVSNSNPDIVIICLTINDRTAGTSPTTVKTNIITQITQWITKCTAAGAATPTFLIVGDYDTGATESDPDTYEVAMREAAAATGSVFISRGAMMGYVGAAGDPESLTVDNKHPGTVGHKLIGRAMAQILLEGAGWAPTAPTDTASYIPSLRTLGTGSTQAAAGNDSRITGAFPATGGAITGATSITVSSASSIPLFLKGAASQTANLLELRNSSGSVMSYAAADGSMVIGGGTTNPSGDGAQRLVVNAENNNGLVVQYAVDGSDWFSVGKLGSGIVAFNGSGGQTYCATASTYGARMNIGTLTAASIGLAIRAVSAQTGNLQEWQDSAGTVMASVTPNGTAKFVLNNSDTSPFNTAPESIWLQNNNGTNNTYNMITSRAGATIDSGIAFQHLDTTNYYGRILFGTRSASGFNTSGLIIHSGGGIYVSNNVAGTVGVAVRAASGQTADIQEWQNNSGTVLGGVSNDGRFFSGIGSAVASVQGMFRAQADTSIPLVVRGSSATQSADLFEIQNSAGTVLFQATAAGVFTATSSSGGFTNGTTNSYGARQSINTVSNGTIGLTIRAAAAGQTANMVEIQNSSGTALALVSPTGDVEVTTSTAGVILRSPDNTRWRLTVDNTGAITTTVVP